jgi:hypothetical protein
MNTGSSGSAIWRVKEQLVIAKTDRPEDCEDMVVMTDSFAAVIDGATSKTSRRWNGQTGGRVAATLIVEAIRQLPADATARVAVDTITERIAALYRQHDVIEIMRDDPVQRVTAAVVAVSFVRGECWLIGDCQCLVGDRHISNELPVDWVTSQARALFLESELLRGRSIEELRANDTGREFIRPLLERQGLFQNNPAAGAFRYAAVDGFPILDEGIVIVPIDASVDTVVLASDGYPFLMPTLAESESRLHAQLADDPLCFRQFRSTKGLIDGQVSFDDRAYLRWSSLY